MATLHLLVFCGKFSKYVGLPRKKIIIIRHPLSVHGSPIWLLLGVSRHGWPARPYYQSDYRVEQSLPHHPQQCLLRMGQVLCVPTQKVRKGSNELLYSVALCNILRSCIITINIIIAIVIACCFVFIVYMITLTNWGRVTHICVSEQGHHYFRKWLVALRVSRSMCQWHLTWNRKVLIRLPNGYHFVSAWIC